MDTENLVMAEAGDSSSKSPAFLGSIFFFPECIYPDTQDMVYHTYNLFDFLW